MVTFDITAPPWHIEPIRLVGTLSGEQVAIVGAPGPTRPVALITDPARQDAADLANARLIAGAPHLYGALVAAVGPLSIAAGFLAGHGCTGSAADVRHIVALFEKIIRDVPAGRRPY